MDSKKDSTKNKNKEDDRFYSIHVKNNPQSQKDLVDFGLTKKELADFGVTDPKHIMY